MESVAVVVYVQVVQVAMQPKMRVNNAALPVNSPTHAPLLNWTAGRCLPPRGPQHNRGAMMAAALKFMVLMEL